jgi:hypothetical protein
VNEDGWISGDGGPLVVLQSGALAAWRGGLDFARSRMMGGDLDTDYDAICASDDRGQVIERHGRSMLVLADCEMPASFVASPLGEVVVVQGCVAEAAVAPLLAQAAACPPSHSLPFAMADDRLRLLVGADDSEGKIYGFTEFETAPGNKTCDFWWIDGSLVVALRSRT